VPNASENGPVAGEFTLTRGGPATSELSVDLAISGSAANGVDYQFVPARVTFLAGQRSVQVPIVPYVDAITELSEVVAISVQPADGYGLGTHTNAQVTILDNMPQ